MSLHCPQNTNQLGVLCRLLPWSLSVPTKAHTFRELMLVCTSLHTNEWEVALMPHLDQECKIFHAGEFQDSCCPAMGHTFRELILVYTKVHKWVGGSIYATSRPRICKIFHAGEFQDVFWMGWVIASAKSTTIITMVNYMSIPAFHFIYGMK